MNDVRAYSLDALRGYAILTMVMSAQVASGVLPAWMYHAQVGPRSGGVFDPSFVGITWVDLVFPFFLFAMGASFPFSLGHRLQRGESRLKLLAHSLSRYFRLAFFAIFIQHAYPNSLASPQDVCSWCLALLAFALLMPMFMRIRSPWPAWVKSVIEWGGYVAGTCFLWAVDGAGLRAFSLSYSNIIILVLANMAFFGSLVYILSWRRLWMRWALLPFVAAILLSATAEGSWQVWLLNATPAPWLYRFLFLKYLFIVLPGTLAGEFLCGWLDERRSCPHQPCSVSSSAACLTACLSLALVVCNLCGLYTRHLLPNLLATCVLLFGLWCVARRMSGAYGRYVGRLLAAGAYLLLLGLCLECLEGGIRKDPSTFSYYFVTSGLACFALMMFSVLCDVKRVGWLTRPLEMAGQNPMVAYVAPQLLVLPVLHLCGLYDGLNLLNTGSWLGLLRGVIVSALALAVATLFTSHRWFWRT